MINDNVTSFTGCFWADDAFRRNDLPNEWFLILVDIDWDRGLVPIGRGFQKVLFLGPEYLACRRGTHDTNAHSGQYLFRRTGGIDHLYDFLGRPGGRWRTRRRQGQSPKRTRHFTERLSQYVIYMIGSSKWWSFRSNE